jgi:hypothetical protein
MRKTHTNRYVPSSNWVACARCNFDYLWPQEMRQEPKGSRGAGLWVCIKCWDGVHPQDRPRRPPRKDRTPPVIRNDGAVGDQEE